MSRPGVLVPLGVVAAIALVVALSAFVGCSASNSAGADNQDGGSTGIGGSSGTAGSNGGMGGSGLGGFSGTMDAGTDGHFPGTGGGTGAGGATGGGGSNFCATAINRISPPPSAGDIEFGPNAQVRVQATANGGGVPTPLTWTWTVTFTDSSTGISTSVKTMLVDSAGSSVAFPVTGLGRYQVLAKIGGSPSPSCLNPMLTFMTVVPGPMKYLLRVSATGLPIQDKPITLADPQPLSFPLTAGIPANLSPQRADMNGGPLTSYIRITDAVSGVSVDGDSTHGSLMAPVLQGSSYDVLVFPVDSYAPQLVSGIPSLWPQPLLLDQGVPVTATTLDSAGNAVAGARTVLRRGPLPSTIGVSDADGVASVFARTGAAPLQVDIVPPIGSGLPSATVGTGDPTTDPGVMLPSGAGSLNLSMKWSRMTSAPMTIHVLAPGGAAISAGVRVRATSKAAPGLVGTLTVQPSVGGPVMLHPTGSTNFEILTDATGTAAFTALPIGDYTVTVIPASTTGSITASSLAITSATMTLAAAGLTSSLILTTKSTLTGMLLPLTDSPGTQITALDQSAIASGAVVSATVATDGTYRLFVDPGHSYELVARPPSSSARGRAVLFPSVSDLAPALPTATLPVGHAVQGQISAGAGTTLGGSLIQIFCPATSSRCLDATFPLAETIARSDGTFDLILPDPPSN